MRQFKDAQGDRWDLEITGGVIKRVMHSPLAVDLGEPFQGDPPLLARLGNVIFLVDLLYVILQPQADQRQLDDEAFAGRLSGETLGAAHEALVESLTDFFRSLKRPEVVRALEKHARFVARARAAMETFLEGGEIDREMERAIAELKQRARDKLGRGDDPVGPGSSSASWPPSPAGSIPSREPSAS